MIYNYDNLAFQILSVGRFAHNEGVYYVKSRPYAALSFRVSGTGSFEIGERSFTVRQGDVMFLPADTPYKVEYSVSESIVVHFNQCNYTEPENVSLDRSTATGILFSQLLDAWSQEHSVNRAKSMVYDLLDRINRERKTAMVSASVADCIRYAEDNFCDPTLDDEALCKIGYISVSGLQRAFREYLGTTPRQYLIKLRMNHAVKLLLRNEMSVKEVAFACGFRDEKYFSRVFKQRYGHTPSALKRNVTV